MTIREHNVTMPLNQIAAFCEKNAIRKLSLFGSALRSDFSQESDVDLLAEFIPNMTPGLFTFLRLQDELSGMVGRAVDLRTPAEFQEKNRARVERGAEILYVQEK